MRSTCEIIADVKENKEVTYEELKLACMVQSFLLFMYQKNVASLLKGGIAAEMTRQAYYSDPKTSSAEYGMSSEYWKAVRMDAQEYLGPGNIPGTPEYEKRYRVSKAVFNKVLSDMEKKEAKAEK